MPLDFEAAVVRIQTRVRCWQARRARDEAALVRGKIAAWRAESLRGAALHACVAAEYGRALEAGGGGAAAARLAALLSRDVVFESYAGVHNGRRPASGALRLWRALAPDTTVHRITTTGGQEDGEDECEVTAVVMLRSVLTGVPSSTGEGAGEGSRACIMDTLSFEPGSGLIAAVDRVIGGGGGGGDAQAGFLERLLDAEVASLAAEYAAGSFASTANRALFFGKGEGGEARETGTPASAHAEDPPAATEEDGGGGGGGGDSEKVARLVRLAKHNEMAASRLLAAKSQAVLLARAREAHSAASLRAAAASVQALQAELAGLRRVPAAAEVAVVAEAQPPLPPADMPPPTEAPPAPPSPTPQGGARHTHAQASVPLADAAVQTVVRLEDSDRLVKAARAAAARRLRRASGDEGCPQQQQQLQQQQQQSASFRHKRLAPDLPLPAVCSSGRTSPKAAAAAAAAPRGSEAAAEPSGIDAGHHDDGRDTAAAEAAVDGAGADGARQSAHGKSGAGRSRRDGAADRQPACVSSSLCFQEPLSAEAQAAAAAAASAAAAKTQASRIPAGTTPLRTPPSERGTKRLRDPRLRQAPHKLPPLPSQTRYERDYWEIYRHWRRLDPQDAGVVSVDELAALWQSVFATRAGSRLGEQCRVEAELAAYRREGGGGGSMDFAAFTAVYLNLVA